MKEFLAPMHPHCMQSRAEPGLVRRLSRLVRHGGRGGLAGYAQVLKPQRPLPKGARVAKKSLATLLITASVLIGATRRCVQEVLENIHIFDPWHFNDARTVSALPKYA